MSWRHLSCQLSASFSLRLQTASNLVHLLLGHLRSLLALGYLAVLPHTRPCQARRASYCSSSSTCRLFLSALSCLLLNNTRSPILQRFSSCIDWRHCTSILNHFLCHSAARIRIETLLEDGILASVQHVIELLLLLRIHRTTANTHVGIPRHKATCVSEVLLSSITVI